MSQKSFFVQSTNTMTMIIDLLRVLFHSMIVDDMIRVMSRCICHCCHQHVAALMLETEHEEGVGGAREGNAVHGESTICSTKSTVSM